MLKRLLPIIGLLFLLQSCVNNSMQSDSRHPQTLPRGLTSSEKHLISSSSDFSYNIFRHVVAADNDKNVFISPLSISMALGMTLNGAEGTTKEGIKKTLGVSEMSLQAINNSYQSLIKLLVNLDPKVKMKIANSLWSRKGFPVEKSFKDSLQNYFNARSDALDFSKLSALQTINGWVSDQTNGRIQKLLQNIPSNVVLYLINAVYFKGNWLHRFDKDKTKPEDFHLSDGSITKVDMMSHKSSTAYFSSDKVKMMQMAYGDSLFNMTVLMPADPQTPINDFVQHTLTSSNLLRWTDRLKPQEVDVEFPKFETKYKTSLNDILKSMGMKEAFDSNKANFANINPSAQLFISQVLHQANITVDEKGSEAAAATAVGFGVTSAGGSLSFYANRPFVYLIRERLSGTILFMGVIRNPRL